MAQKTDKVILFIVEGPTDENALSPILKTIFQSEDVRFHVVYGDISTDRSVTVTNVIKRIYEYVNIEMERYGFQRKDIIKIIHLVDTDGAFIPPTQIFCGKSKTIKYFDNYIESFFVQETIKRNEKKSQILRQLYLKEKIASIPYKVYYFSRNLEHVLHGDNRDLTNDEKMEYADTFADKYHSNPDEFKLFISSPDFCVCGDYKDTWVFITQDTNSLHRHCNLHLLFQDNANIINV